MNQALKLAIEKATHANPKAVYSLLNSTFEKMSDSQARNFGGGVEKMLEEGGGKGIGIVRHILSQYGNSFMLNKKFLEALGKALEWEGEVEMFFEDGDQIKEQRLLPKSHYHGLKYGQIVVSEGQKAADAYLMSLLQEPPTSPIN